MALTSLRRPMLATMMTRSFASSPDDVVEKLTTEEKEQIRQFRRAETIRANVKEIKANPLIGRDMKIAKHPEQRFTTAVLTNGATVFTRLPYYTSKYLRLEEDYISIAANQKIRPLPLKEKRVQPPKYAKGRRRPKRVE